MKLEWHGNTYHDAETGNMLGEILVGAAGIDAQVHDRIFQLPVTEFTYLPEAMDAVEKFYDPI